MVRPSNNKIRDEAADWVTKIQSGSVDPGNCAELRAWLDESPENQQVFQRMLDIFSRSELLAAATVPECEISVPAANWLGTYGLAAAASLLVAIAIGFWSFSAATLQIETHTGERILMSLEDGSSVHLNSQSQVEMRFTDDARIATMPAGEILFSVNSDDPRPFFVRTDGLDIEVTGTTFQVTRYGATEAAVSVLEGEVLVEPATDRNLSLENNGSRVSLRQGQQVRYHDAKLGSPTNIDITRVAAWRDGWLYLDGQPMQELVDRLNRHFDVQIELRDEQLAKKEVSLALRLARRDETLASIARVLSVDFEELPGNRSIVHDRR